MRERIALSPGGAIRSFAPHLTEKERPAEAGLSWGGLRIGKEVVYPTRRMRRKEALSWLHELRMPGLSASRRLDWIVELGS